MFVQVLLLQSLFVCSQALRRDLKANQGLDFIQVGTSATFAFNSTEVYSNTSVQKDGMKRRRNAYIFGLGETSTSITPTWGGTPPTWKPYVTYGRTLGAGAFGKVMEVFVKCPGTSHRTALAVKCLDVKQSSRENATKEGEVLASIREYLAGGRSGGKEDLSPFVLAEVVPKTIIGDFFYFVMPMYDVPGFKPTSYEEIVDQDSVGRRFGGNAAKWGFLLHTAKGLLAVHEAGWVHKDVKPSNTMISCEAESQAIGQCHAVVIDHGLAQKTGKAMSAKGTPGYMPPEVFQELGPVSPAVDVWSLGMMIWESFFTFDAMPWYHRDIPQQSSDIEFVCLRKIISDHRWLTKVINQLPCSTSFPECGFTKTLLNTILKPRAADRPSMTEVIGELETKAPALMKVKGIFPATSVQAAACLDPKPRPQVKTPPQTKTAPSRVRDQMKKQFSCCYQPAKVWYGKNSHAMVSGTTCHQKGWTRYDCKALSCKECWDACCRFRHNIRTSKCTEQRAATKRELECRSLS